MTTWSSRRGESFSNTSAPEQFPALWAHSLYRFFRAGEEETVAVRGVSLQVAAGEIVAVAGPSGSGKSTLLALLAGLDEPDGGTVRIRGERISHQEEPVRARMRATSIGILFQSGNLLAHLSVTENVDLAQQLSDRQTRRAIPSLLTELGLTSRAAGYPAELSGGELARAGLAVALANDPAVLLADEPTGELDGATETEVLKLLRARAESGIAVLVASHSPAVSAAADRVLRLRDGAVS